MIVNKQDNADDGRGAIARMSICIPRRLRMEIRRRAAERDISMQREVERVLADAYGIEV